MHAQPCANNHSFVCAAGADTWKVTISQGPGTAGAAACRSEFPGSRYAVPANGWENTLLRAAAGSRPVWLNYADASGRGNWQA